MEILPAADKHLLTDDELRDLLFEAGLTPYEIEAHCAEFPEAKLVLDAIHKILVHRLVKRLMQISAPNAPGN